MRAPSPPVVAAALAAALSPSHVEGAALERVRGEGTDPRLAVAWERGSYVMESRSYVLRSDLERAVTERLAAHLDRMSDEYAALMSGLRERRSGRRLQVYLFRDQECYRSTLDLRFDADGAGTGGMTVRDGTEITLAAWQGDRPVELLERTLRHEGFHQFKEIYFPNMPPWANEGLAEVFEAAVVLEDGIVLGEVPAEWLRTVRDAAAAGGLPPLAELFEVDAERWQDHVNAGRGAVPYAQAWSVVHFLVFGEERRYLPSFERFLVLMNRGLSWRSAFQQAMGLRDLGPMGERWRAYVAGLEPTDLEGTIARLEFLAAGLLELAAGGREPASLEELRAALRENGFSYQTGRFGIRRRLAAGDDSVFAVPGGAGGAGGAGGSSAASFVLRDGGERREGGAVTGPGGAGVAGPRAVPRRVVATQGLRPVEFRITWEAAPPGDPPKWLLVSEPSGGAAAGGRRR